MRSRPVARAESSMQSRQNSQMDTARLAMMADQIARNFAAQGEEAAIVQTADHIRQFWDPRMKAAIRAADRSSLSPLAAKAIDLI